MEKDSVSSSCGPQSVTILRLREAKQPPEVSLNRERHEETPALAAGLWELMTEEEPSQWEQDLAQAYVNERPLHRPDTRLRHAVIFTSIFLAVTILLTSVIILALRSGALTTSTLLPSEFVAMRPVLATVIIHGLISLLALGVCGRYIVIGIVRLYQHYAPERIRRRCLFQPTCSEYAILAVLRYGVVLGCIKAFDRLHSRCRGSIYRIDYP